MKIITPYPKCEICLGKGWAVLTGTRTVVPCWCVGFHSKEDQTIYYAKEEAERAAKGK